MPDAWATAPTVEIPPPPVAHCPKCRRSNYIIVRSMGDQGDGSILRRVVCRRCSTRFKIVVDPDLASDWQNG